MTASAAATSSKLFIATPAKNWLEHDLMKQRSRESYSKFLLKVIRSWDLFQPVNRILPKRRIPKRHTSNYSPPAPRNHASTVELLP